MTRSYRNQFLPTQPQNRNLCEFAGDQLVDAIWNECQRVNRVPNALENIGVPEGHDLSSMAANPITVALLKMLVAIHQPKVFIEVGAYVGSTMLQIASVMPHDGRIAVTEPDPAAHEALVQNIQINPPPILITAHCDEGVMPCLWDPRSGDYTSVDMAFIDGGKQDYLDHLRTVMEHSNPGCVIVIDDVFFHGDVWNDPPVTPKGRGCRQVLDFVASWACQWQRTLLLIANGVLILQKPRH